MKERNEEGRKEGEGEGEEEEKMQLWKEVIS